MTPLIEITSLGFPNGNRVFAKCENNWGLSHSHYDRIYRLLFDRLPDEVHANSNDYHLFETSSGNAGTSFARYCELYGFKGTVVFPKEVRPERLATIKQSNVNVIVSEYDDYMIGALRTLIKVMKEQKKSKNKALFLNHSQSWQSARAMEICGREISMQLSEFNTTPDIFVSALGNGSSMSGIGLGLRIKHPKLDIIGFEPKSTPVVTDLRNGIKKHRSEYKTSSLTGTGVYGIDFPNLKLHLLSEVYLIEEFGTKGAKWSNNIRRVEREFSESIGLTSAAAISVAEKLAEKVSNKTIIVVFYDIAQYYGL